MGIRGSLVDGGGMGHRTSIGVREGLLRAPEVVGCLCSPKQSLGDRDGHVRHRLAQGAAHIGDHSIHRGAGIGRGV
jgi:hypothetical protein